MTASPSFRFKRRTYLHFDLPVSLASAERLACNPNNVANHSFYPFLGYTNVIKKITRDEQGQIVRTQKNREIKIAAHRDAAIYARYADLLSPAYEAELERRGLGKVVTAFRQTGGTNIDFAGEVFHYINFHRPCIALAFDLEKFFDTLDHNLLKQQWIKLLGVSRLPNDHFSVFRSLTSFCWVSRDETFKKLGISLNNPKANNRRRICCPRDFRQQIRESGLLHANPTPEKGIPQGSPISALLSNIYMLDFDEMLYSGITQLGGIYRRYCDDIMIVVPSGHCHRHVAEALVASAVRAAKLNFNSDKTNRAEFPGEQDQVATLPKQGSGFSDCIQYLGFTYNGSQTLIRPSSLGRYYGKMRAGVRLAKQTKRKHNRGEFARGLNETPLRTRKLYIQYSYLISRRTSLPGRDRKAQGNFLTYAYRAAKKLSAPEIKGQVRNHWKKLQEQILE